MFTGIIETVAPIVACSASATGGWQLIIRSDLPFAVGESVSLNGVCLTVVSRRENQVVFDLSPETLSKSYFNRLMPGNVVNVERSVPATGRLSGHFVLGHVDGLGAIRSRMERGDFLQIDVEIPTVLSRYTVTKGSIAVDGVSLTINQVNANTLALWMIPETVRRTNFQFKKVGDPVHIEVDILGKYVEKFIQGVDDVR